ncbi:hypothetical protein QJS04_geneDACA013262 [Acorus gramineus]|uniref:Ankyrin repeat domain-containing protein EMB506, chloroplastic n=1 Tax=Acorus gramineus TaxID=55184 RepID=A0AAV9B7X8_ACOGR|nr:hypothetical protein QJS04_geneDACA013262 [Acorus gramineus]
MSPPPSAMYSPPLPILPFSTSARTNKTLRSPPPIRFPPLLARRVGTRGFSFAVRLVRQPDLAWEDPVIDEEDDEEDNEEHNEEIATSPYANLVKEVESLLGQEKMAILARNETPDLTKISTPKWSLFHTLAMSGQIALMDELLGLGADIDAADKDGYTALHRAVIGKKEAVISHLLRKGANPHVRDRDGATPLHSAVQVGAMQTVKLLIKYKVDVNIADDEGWTPLHVAIQSRNRDIAKVLLVNSADKTRRNKDGKTPLDISLCYGKDFKSYDLAKLLKLVPANRGS